MRFKKLMLILIGFMVFTGCGHKKTDSQTDDAAVEIDDFLDMFPRSNLPLSFSDSSLVRKNKDSVLHWVVYNKFGSDSLIEKNFGKGARPKLYASGKIVVKDAERYLFVKAMGTEKKALYVLCFDKANKFKTGMPLVIKDENSDIHYLSSIDNKYTITVTRQHKDNEGKWLYKKNVYVYNDEGIFSLILYESNEDKPKMTQIFNPIDTLSHKRKFAGDYMQDKRNFISFRDGRNSTVLRFFIHFEKENGSCKGELRGDAKFVSPNIARYSSSGDPCSLQFDFTDKNVRMKELEGCGNHRDIRCYFDGVYDRKKEIKSKPSKVSKTKKPKYVK